MVDRRRWCWSRGPIPSAIAEAERTRGELAALGMVNLHLVVNGVFTASDATDARAGALEQRGRAALAQLTPGLMSLPRTTIALQPWAPMGVESLRRVLDDGRDRGGVGDDDPGTRHGGDASDDSRSPLGDRRAPATARAIMTAWINPAMPTTETSRVATPRRAPSPPRGRRCTTSSMGWPCTGVA